MKRWKAGDKILYLNCAYLLRGTIFIATSVAIWQMSNN